VGLHMARARDCIWPMAYMINHLTGGPPENLKTEKTPGTADPTATHFKKKEVPQAV
jgi:hypothetical protein